MEAQQDSVQAAEELVHWDQLEKVIASATQALQAPDLAESYGVQCPMDGPDEEAVRHFVKKKYVALYKGFEESLKKRASQSAAAKARTETLDAVACAANPASLFDDAVEAVVTNRLEKFGYGVDAAQPAEDTATKFLDAITSQS